MYIMYTNLNSSDSKEAATKLTERHAAGTAEERAARTGKTADDRLRFDSKERN